MAVDLIKAIQNRLAIVTIGASTLRGQGASGVVSAARAYLASVRLGFFACLTETEFLTQLDNATEELKAALPAGGRSWGAARKAINLFLRDALYNVYLREQFGLSSSERWYEVPLDSAVAGELIARQSEHERVLPRWKGVKHLKKEVSDQFQTFAWCVAKKMNILRVHLDAYLWVDGR